MHPFLETYNRVNAFGRWMGMELEYIAPGEVRYRMPLKAEHLSNPLAAHGGAISALMDGILGVAALSLAVEDGRLVSTVEFKINYYAPIQAGDILVGHGLVVFAGRRIMSSEGEIRCENREGLLLCKGLGTFNAYPADKNPLFMAGNEDA